MELTLAPNVLYEKEQTLSFNKVATLIGENGCGKSTILHSIFNARASEDGEEHGRLICFTSGQNENYSRFFSKRIDGFRNPKTINDMDFGCLYFTKRDIRSLIFLSSTFVSSGLVRRFLKDRRYITEKDDFDQTSVLSVQLEVPKNYIQRVIDDAKREAMDFDHPSIRKRPFNQRLEKFIEKIGGGEDFDSIIGKGEGLPRQEISSSSVVFFNGFDGSKIDAIKFLVEGAYNGYFIDSSRIKLYFKDGLEFEELSDGEYQLLFLYALIDLFDADDALFLFDEADSHLHYTNIRKLWMTNKHPRRKRTGY